MLAPTKPINSRVQIHYTLTSQSIDRKHPSHYVQEGNGAIFIYLNDGSCKLVGSFHFWLVQVFQAFASKVMFHEMFVNDLLPVMSLYDNTCHFREDLGLNDCNHLAIIDQFEITDPICEHELFKSQCIEEFIRVFAYIEVVAVHLAKVKVEIETFNKMKFARASETEFVIRDNCQYTGGEMASYVAEMSIPPDDSPPMHLPPGMMPY